MAVAPLSANPYAEADAYPTRRKRVRPRPDASKARPSKRRPADDASGERKDEGSRRKGRSARRTAHDDTPLPSGPPPQLKWRKGGRTQVPPHPQEATLAEEFLAYEKLLEWDDEVALPGGVEARAGMPDEGPRFEWAFERDLGSLPVEERHEPGFATDHGSSDMPSGIDSSGEFMEPTWDVDVSPERDERALRGDDLPTDAEAFEGVQAGVTLQGEPTAVPDFLARQVESMEEPAPSYPENGLEGEAVFESSLDAWDDAVGAEPQMGSLPLALPPAEGETDEIGVRLSLTHDEAPAMSDLLRPPVQDERQDSPHDASAASDAKSPDEDELEPVRDEVEPAWHQPASETGESGLEWHQPQGERRSPELLPHEEQVRDLVEDAWQPEYDDEYEYEDVDEEELPPADVAVEEEDEKGVWQQPKPKPKRPYVRVRWPRNYRSAAFWICYALLVFVLVGVGILVLTHTYDSLVRYEESQPQVFMDHLVQDLQEGGPAAEQRRAQCLDGMQLAPYDSRELLDERFSQGIGQASYRYEQEGGSFDANAPVYTVYVNDAPFVTLHLEPAQTYVRLGLLSITDWDVASSLVYGPTMVENETANVDTGLAYGISVAENTKVYVNGQELTSEDLSEEPTILAGFEYAAQFVDPPEAVTYRVEGLHTDPQVAAVSFEGAEVELAQVGNAISATSLTVPNRTPEELPVDVLGLAETWSKLMTSDLGNAGNSYGIDAVTPFLIPGSELYTFATNFVNSIDITFVHSHSIDSFTEEAVTNCVMYNDNLFSCDVHFVKNMTVYATGEARADVFDNNMIFAYVDDYNVVSVPGWYLVNMQANTEGM